MREFLPDGFYVLRQSSRGRKCLEELLWGKGECADRDTNKGFQAAEQPAEAAEDDFVVAPTCVGCDFLQQSSGAQKSERRESRPDQPDRTSSGTGRREGRV